MRADRPAMTEAAFVASGADQSVAAQVRERPAEAGARDQRWTILVLEKQLLLGDALQHVPAYRALRFAFPDRRIVSLSRRESTFNTSLAPIRHLFVDEAATDQPIDEPVSRQRSLADGFGPLELVLDFRSSTRAMTSFFAFAGKAKRYIANAPGYVLRKGLAFGVETRPASNAERSHRLVEIAAGCNLPFDSSIPALASADAQAAAILPGGARYFGIATGPVGSVKSWPRDRHVAVASAIRALGYKPVILLGTHEADQRAWYEQNIPDATIVDVRVAGGDGAYHLWLLHSVAARLAGCVANENGLGHLVASRGIPLLTLAGPTNPFRWRPLTPQWWVRRAQEFGSDSLAAIPAEAVSETIALMARWESRKDENRLQASAPEAS